MIIKGFLALFLISFIYLPVSAGIPVKDRNLISVTDPTTPPLKKPARPPKTASPQKPPAKTEGTPPLKIRKGVSSFPEAGTETPKAILPRNLDLKRKHFLDSLTLFLQEYQQEAILDTFSLESCLKMAEENSNDLAIAISKSRAAADNIDKVKSQKNPTLSALGTYSRTGPIPQFNIPGFGGNIKIMNDVNYDLKFTAQYLITNFGTFENAKKVAYLNYIQTKVGEDRVKSDLDLKILESFFTVVETKGFVAVAMQAIKAKELQCNLAKANYEAGTFPKFEVIQANVGLKNAQLEVIKAAKRLELVKANMRNLLGLKQTKEFDIRRPRFILHPVPDLESAIKTAYENRPEVTQLDIAVDIATTNVDLAYSGYNPTLLLVTTYDYQTENFARTPTQWNLALNLQVPIFDGGLAWAQIKQAKEALLQAKLAREQLKRDIALQVKSAHLSVNESIKKMETAEANLEQAQEAYDIALVRYQEGLSTHLELDNSLVDWLNSHAALISAYCEYQRSWASLIYAMGLSLKGVYYEQGAKEH